MYVTRDANNKIVKIHSKAQFEGQEFVEGAEIGKTPKQVLGEALEGLVYDFGDDRVIQVRPKDEQNIRNAIELMNRHGIPTKSWRMADNSNHLVTPDDLQAALESGQDQGDAAWAAFFAAVG